MYKLLALLFFISTYLVGCQNTNDFGENFKFTEKELQAEFLVILDKKDVPYKIDKEGFVWYSTQDKTRVSKIIRELIAYEHSGNSVTIDDKKYIVMLTNEMDKSQIPYELKTRNGKARVVWPKEYNERVRGIINNLQESDMNELYQAKNSEE